MRGESHRVGREPDETELHDAGDQHRENHKDQRAFDERAAAAAAARRFTAPS